MNEQKTYSTVAICRLDSDDRVPGWSRFRNGDPYRSTGRQELRIVEVPLDEDLHLCCGR